ncbi:TIGR00730 family protein [Kwoniella heveanensis CBS 569]|nr:TIGR00730 family protein [Kwoniella heveanensis CBS 569]
MSVPSPFSANKGLKKPVCVFCGSSPGKLKLYTIASESVGQALANESIPLVYGGGRRGIMGVVSQASLQSGGYVHGIIPRALTERASEHTPAPGTNGESSLSRASDVNGNGASQEGTGETILTDESGGRFTTDIVGSMHERKMKMAKLSQGGFIVLPGGFGTFEEVLEMITWNQLGIHRLPILILNIGNFYAHLKLQFVKAVEAGFIPAANLSLCQVVNLAGGDDESLNSDESRAGEWGQAAIQALKDWQFAEDTGYGIDWELKEKRAGGDESVLNAKSANATSTLSSGISRTVSSLRRPEALFTTLRYTSPSLHESTIPIERSSIPLLDYHVLRLREAHAHFRERDSSDVWGEWMGDQRLWELLKDALEAKEKEVRGDWRVRVVLHPGSKLEVQVVPAPRDAGPSSLATPEKQQTPTTATATARRPLILDPIVTDLSQKDSDELDLRLYKTTDRGMYDTAYARGGALLPPDVHPEVLLHTSSLVLETTTSNIAVLPPLSSSTSTASTTGHNQKHNPETTRKWLTPRLTRRGTTPQERGEEGATASASAYFLNGAMRRYFLDNDIIQETDLTVDELRQMWSDGGRIIGFNGLR